MVERLGEGWWASLAEPTGSGPGYRRPVAVVQSDELDRSRIRTVVVVATTSNLRLAAAPGNVAIGRRGTGLPRESVVTVSLVLTLDGRLLGQRQLELPGDDN